MGNISATTTLDGIVKDFQHITGRGDREYYRLLNLAGRALQEIRRFHASTIVNTKEYNLSNLTNGVLPYPEDCIGVIGVEYQAGSSLFPASQRDDIVYGTNASGSVSYVNEINDNYAANYGTPGGRNEYYYTDDKVNRRLIFDYTADEKIWLRYVSTGIDANLGEDTIVPKEYQDFIENFILFQEALKHQKGQRNAVELYKKYLNQASRQMRAFNSPTLSEWYDVLAGTFGQRAKR